MPLQTLPEHLKNPYQALTKHIKHSPGRRKKTCSICPGAVFHSTQTCLFKKTAVKNYNNALH